MTEPMPYTVAEVEALPRDERDGIVRQGVRVSRDRLLATVRALEAAMKQIATLTLERDKARHTRRPHERVECDACQGFGGRPLQDGGEEGCGVCQGSGTVTLRERVERAVKAATKKAEAAGWASPEQVREVANLAWRHGFAYALGREVEGVEASGDMPAIIARVLGGGR